VTGSSASPPYPGARPFQQADRDRFFGRADQIATLGQSWQTNRLTLMAGQAGAGKTSLLHAGLLPLLARENLNVLPIGRLSYGATFPFAALPAHNPYTLSLLRSWSPAETVTRLAGLTIREFVQRQIGKGHILAAIDPADELLADTGQRRVHRRRFLSEIAEVLATSPRFHLLVLAREEAIDVLTDALDSGVRYDVTKLSWPDALEALSQPSAATNKSFADGAAERLLTDLQTSRITGENGAVRYITDDYVEPALLQVVCTHLWTSLPSDVKLITARDIRSYGDVDTALATHWGSVIAEVANDHDITARQLISWLQRTFVTELGSRNQTYEGATATAGMPNAVVRALEDRHLLTSRRQSGARWYELLSDRLIESLRSPADVRPPVFPPTYYLRAAERALTLGELDLAERYTKEILRSGSRPDSRLQAEAHSLAGNLACEREKPQEAETHYREAAQLYGVVSESQAVAYQLAAIGRTLEARGHFADAVEELHAAAGRMPNDLIIRIALARALWQHGMGHAAVAELTRVLGTSGGNAEALHARGEILADLGEARSAMLDLDRVDLQGRPSTRAARGLALAGLGDQPAARREIDDAVAEARRSGPVLLYAARAFREGGDEMAARDFARRATDATEPPLSPTHREAARRLAGDEHG
jgi:tetratricopeptide (TPR) repeat protein